jgi:hypothetical protein
VCAMRCGMVCSERQTGTDRTIRTPHRLHRAAPVSRQSLRGGVAARPPLSECRGRVPRDRLTAALGPPSWWLKRETQREKIRTVKVVAGGVGARER